MAAASSAEQGGSQSARERFFLLLKTQEIVQHLSNRACRKKGLLHINKWGQEAVPLFPSLPPAQPPSRSPSLSLSLPLSFSYFLLVHNPPPPHSSPPCSRNWGSCWVGYFITKHSFYTSKKDPPDPPPHLPTQDGTSCAMCTRKTQAPILKGSLKKKEMALAQRESERMQGIHFKAWISTIRLPETRASVSKLLLGTGRTRLDLKTFLDEISLFSKADSIPHLRTPPTPHPTPPHYTVPFFLT